MDDAEILTAVNDARSKFYSGDQMDALADLEAFQLREPDEPTSLLALGAMYYRAGFPLFGRTLIDKIAEMAPDDANVHLVLSSVQFADGDTDRAVRSLERAEALAWEEELPNRNVLRRIHAYGAFYQGDYRRVIEQYQDLPPLDDDNHYLHVLVANSYFNVGDWDNARRLSLPLVERNPKDASLLWTLAASEAKMGKSDDALASYEKAFLSFPDSLPLCAALVKQALLRGRLRSAWRYILIASKHDAK